jgi:hypothetical protein
MGGGKGGGQGKGGGYRELTYYPTCPSIPPVKECYLKDYYLTFKSHDKSCTTNYGGVDIHVETLEGGKYFKYHSNNGKHGNKCEVRTTP